ncbi:MAG TPA: aldo/keto reductase [Actinopolymorphaceae bacterium]|nr:aldo/keto reductase [Actinopolymorphaceae bacterium]
MTSPTPTRTLGRSGIAVSPIGFGCWAIGGPAFRDGNPIGWGKVDDDESVAAINAALDAGITFFDTANIYGAGHSERVVGRALAGRFGEVVIATKFGNLFDEDAKRAIGRDASPASIREQCDASLARLGTDVIDLYQFHIGDYDPERAQQEVVPALEELVAAGKIRSFGWSTDDPERAVIFARSPHCSAIQLHANVIDDNPAMVDLIEAENLAGVNRGPLAMGALTGKFSSATTFADDDVRRRFDFSGKEGRTLAALDRIRDVLTSGGRTLAQGSLGWLLARSPAFVPIPGIRTVAQAQDNAGAITHGPLDEQQMAEIDKTLQELSLR